MTEKLTTVGHHIVVSCNCLAPFVTYSSTLLYDTGPNHVIHSLEQSFTIHKNLDIFYYSTAHFWKLQYLYDSKPFVFTDLESENCDLTELPQDTLNIIEADSYWCMSKLLDGIQDNYTFAQPGIQMKVNALKGLIKRINGK